jgi:hypothetical protein
MARAGVHIFEAMMKLGLRAVSLSAAIAASFVAGDALAADDTSNAEAFGAQGHLAVSSDAGFSLTHTSIGDNGGDSTNVLFMPAADYFVIQNLSLGGFVGVDYLSFGNDVSTTTFTIGPRVGYDIALADKFSFWPRGGFFFDSVSLSTTTTINGMSQTSSASTTHLGLNLSAPFLYHPVPHFFLGIGPLLSTDLTGDRKQTTFGAGFTIGGYFGD